MSDSRLVLALLLSVPACADDSEPCERLRLDEGWTLCVQTECERTDARQFCSGAYLVSYQGADEWCAVSCVDHCAELCAECLGGAEWCDHGYRNACEGGRWHARCLETDVMTATPRAECVCDGGTEDE